MSAGSSAPPRPVSGAPSRNATCTACSPPARRLPRGATSIRPPPGARGEPASRGEGVVLSHTAVHEGGFTIARDPGTAIWHTYRPDGVHDEEGSVSAGRA